jgi:citrate lyase subunit beta/citryl-CoA lyase
MTLRRTSLYIPGNNPGMLLNAAVYGADSIVLDLEDAVSVAEKDAARILVRNALRSISYRDVEVTVRVNSLSTPFGREDFEEIVPLAPSVLRLPKCETADDVLRAEKLIGELEEKSGVPAGSVKLIPIIESAFGASNLPEIVRSSPRVAALNFGAEDYTADLGAERTKEGRELDDIRSRIVAAARIAGIQALDSVFADVNDSEGLFEEAFRVRRLGFDGKSVIHPRQIAIVHRAFTPSEKEIEYAGRVVAAIEEAAVRKSGVVALNGRMIDAPVVAKARKVLALAEAAGVHRIEESRP